MSPGGSAAGPGARPLVLLGLRCSGKTSVGRRLAERLGRPFVDLDDALAEVWAAEHGSPPRSAGELLADLGEPAFRDLEGRALRRALERGDAPVVAPGAGCVERADNRERLARVATCVLLEVGIGTLRRRLAADATFRPALEGSDPIEEMERVARRRAPLYASLADVTIECGEDDVEAVVERILAQGVAR